MFLKRRKAEREVSEGDVFRRTTRGPAAETARVLCVHEDGMGILHVRFSTHPDRPEGAACVRTLSLASFRSLYPERT